MTAVAHLQSTVRLQRVLPLPQLPSRTRCGTKHMLVLLGCLSEPPVKIARLELEVAALVASLGVVEGFVECVRANTFASGFVLALLMRRRGSQMLRHHWTALVANAAKASGKVADTNRAFFRRAGVDRRAGWRLRGLDLVQLQSLGTFLKLIERPGANQ